MRQPGNRTGDLWFTTPAPQPLSRGSSMFNGSPFIDMLITDGEAVKILYCLIPVVYASFLQN